jgi:hypothetical protein
MLAETLEAAHGDSDNKLLRFATTQGSRALRNLLLMDGDVTIAIINHN